MAVVIAAVDSPTRFASALGDKSGIARFGDAHVAGRAAGRADSRP